MDSSELRIAHRPTLRDPVLITAFRGWNDGGQAATLAGGYLAREWRAVRFADVDPELFVDFQATRPTVSLDEGLTRRIDWPENVFYWAQIPGLERDAVILLGVEPNYRWRAFTDLVAGFAERAWCGARRHAGGAARRRPAHPAGAGHRRRERSGAGGGARVCSCRGTRDRPASSACSTTRAAAPASSR